MLVLKKLLNRFRAGSPECVNRGPRKRDSNYSVVIHILVLLNQLCKYAQCASQPRKLVNLVREIFH